MPPTDSTDLYELFVRLFVSRGDRAMAADWQGGENSSDAGDSLLQSPMQILNALPETFSELYGQSGDIFVHLAEIAAHNGDVEMATLFCELGKIVADEALELASDRETLDHRIDFVYPVV